MVTRCPIGGPPGSVVPKSGDAPALGFLSAGSLSAWKKPTKYSPSFKPLITYSPAKSVVAVLPRRGLPVGHQPTARRSAGEPSVNLTVPLMVAVPPRPGCSCTGRPQSVAMAVSPGSDAPAELNATTSTSIDAPHPNV